MPAWQNHQRTTKFSGVEDRGEASEGDQTSPPSIAMASSSLASGWWEEISRLQCMDHGWSSPMHIASAVLAGTVRRIPCKPNLAVRAASKLQLRGGVSHLASQNGKSELTSILVKRGKEPMVYMQETLELKARRLRRPRKLHSCTRHLQRERSCVMRMGDDGLGRVLILGEAIQTRCPNLDSYDIFRADSHPKPYGRWIRVARCYPRIITEINLFRPMSAVSTIRTSSWKETLSSDGEWIWKRKKEAHGPR